jgi:hypothetical protein
MGCKISIHYNPSIFPSLKRYPALSKAEQALSVRPSAADQEIAWMERINIAPDGADVRPASAQNGGLIFRHLRQSMPIDQIRASNRDICRPHQATGLENACRAD